MTTTPTPFYTRGQQRVLDVAERLFGERGYAAVTLRDIATELGIRRESLYYHLPGGKDQIFVDATMCRLERYRTNLERLIAESGPDLQSRLCAVAEWLLSQPPLDTVRLIRSDIAELSSDQARQLMDAACRALLTPIERAVMEAEARGEARPVDRSVFANAFLSFVEGTRTCVPSSSSTASLVSEMTSILLDGLRPR